MIRSSRLSLKFVNKTKRGKIDLFIGEYAKLVSLFIDKLWGSEMVPVLLPKSMTASAVTPLSTHKFKITIYDPVDWDGFRYFREIVYASFQYGPERCSDPTDLNPAGKETPDVASPQEKTI